MSVLETNKFVKLVIGAEEIHCTPEHPFQVKSKGFIEAGQLELGDLVYNNDLQTFAVESVEYYETEELVKVYNFTVEDYHTYFVGDNCLIVHNVKCNVNKMNKDIQTGKAPNGVKRIDQANTAVANSKPHAHLANKTSFNIDGTVHDATNGISHLTRAMKDWFASYGWKWPK